jgi:hypothetical protein
VLVWQHVDMLGTKAHTEMAQLYLQLDATMKSCDGKSITENNVVALSVTVWDECGETVQSRNNELGLKWTLKWLFMLPLRNMSLITKIVQLHTLCGMVNQWAEGLCM